MTGMIGSSGPAGVQGDTGLDGPKGATGPPVKLLVFLFLAFLFQGHIADITQKFRIETSLDVFTQFTPMFYFYTP